MKISAVVAEIHPSVTTIATSVFTFFFVVRSESFEYIHPINSPIKKSVVLTTMSVVVTGDTILVCHFSKYTLTNKKEPQSLKSFGSSHQW